MKLLLIFIIRLLLKLIYIKYYEIPSAFSFSLIFKRHLLYLYFIRKKSDCTQLLHNYKRNEATILLYGSQTVALSSSRFLIVIFDCNITGFTGVKLKYGRGLWGHRYFQWGAGLCVLFAAGSTERCFLFYLFIYFIYCLSPRLWPLLVMFVIYIYEISPYILLHKISPLSSLPLSSLNLFFFLIYILTISPVTAV